VNITKISAGRNPPHEINVVIENPRGDGPVKYEFDTASGAIFVSRLLYTAMFYPADYGFIPNTLSRNGTPLDCLVMGQHPLIPGCVLPSRPIGALILEDERGPDQKILAVPVDKLHPYYENIATYRDLRVDQIEKIEHFFSHYKDLEKNKWVRVKQWTGPERAAELIREGIVRHEAQPH